MPNKRVCQEIIEAIARQNPRCPLARHCHMFMGTCQVSNIIDLSDGQKCEVCGNTIKQTHWRSDV